VSLSCSGHPFHSHLLSPVTFKSPHYPHSFASITVPRSFISIHSAADPGKEHSHNIPASEVALDSHGTPTRLRALCLAGDSASSVWAPWLRLRLVGADDEDGREDDDD
jgi:hypothetical protein